RREFRHLRRKSNWLGTRATESALLRPFEFSRRGQPVQRQDRRTRLSTSPKPHLHAIPKIERSQGLERRTARTTFHLACSAQESSQFHWFRLFLLRRRPERTRDSKCTEIRKYERQTQVMEQAGSWSRSDRIGGFPIWRA